MIYHFIEYGDGEQFFNGIVKFAMRDENTAVLEADRNGLISFCRFIMIELVNNAEDEYAWYQLLSQIGDLADGSLDLFIDNINGLNLKTSKAGKTYQEYNFGVKIDIENESEYLLEENAYLKIEHRQNAMICIRGNTAGLITLCKFMLILANDDKHEIFLTTADKSTYAWGELTDDSMTLLILKLDSN